MSLINRVRNLGYHHLTLNGNSYQAPESFIWTLRAWEDKDYFFVSIFRGNVFETYPIETIVPKDVLDKIRNDDKTFLYVCNSHEAFLDIVEPLYKSLVFEAGIPPKKIYVANEAADLYKEVIKYADNNNLEYMNIEWILEFESGTGIETNRHKFDGSTILTDKHYDKRFLCFNRRWRLHRTTLVAMLKATKLLDKGYVSLAPCDDARSWLDQWGLIKSLYMNDSEIDELFTKNEDAILSIPPLYLDTEDMYENHYELKRRSLYLYENSLVSVVTETTFYQSQKLVYPVNHARFLSEKIFKPIGVGHPFILMSVPKSLELLKSLGYKTFHPFIDESYDDEFDDIERLKMIVKEIEKIVNFTDDEVKEFCKNVKEICNFNQQLLKDKSITYLTGENFEHKNKFTHENYIKKTL